MKRILFFILFSIFSLSGEQEIKAYMKKHNNNLDNFTINRIFKTVVYYSKKYEVDPVLVLSVMKTESHFKHSTVSSAGAKGLMQLMPFNFKEFSVDNSIEGNIKGGILHLKRDLKNTGNVTKTLVCYNAGCGRLKNNQWLKIEETTDYVTKINKVYPEIKKLYYVNTNKKKNKMSIQADYIELNENESIEKSREVTKQEKFQRNKIGFERSIDKEEKQ